MLVISTVSGEKCPPCTFKVPLHAAICGCHLVKLPPKKDTQVMSSNKAAFSIFQTIQGQSAGWRGQTSIFRAQRKEAGSAERKRRVL